MKFSIMDWNKILSISNIFIAAANIIVATATSLGIIWAYRDFKITKDSNKYEKFTLLLEDYEQLEEKRDATYTKILDVLREESNPMIKLFAIFNPIEYLSFRMKMKNSHLYQIENNLLSLELKRQRNLDEMCKIAEEIKIDDARDILILKELDDICYYYHYKDSLKLLHHKLSSTLYLVNPSDSSLMEFYYKYGRGL